MDTEILKMAGKHIMPTPYGGLAKRMKAIEESPAPPYTCAILKSPYSSYAETAASIGNIHFENGII